MPRQEFKPQRASFSHLLQGLIWSLCTAFVTLQMSSCSKPQSSSNPDTISVKIPWQSSGGDYSQQVVEVMGVTDRATFTGQYAQFYLSPGENNGQLAGYSPQVKLVKTGDGFYVPADYLSTQLVTLYAHFERLAEQDQINGASSTPGWLAQKKIAVSVLEAAAAGQWVSDNAAYDGDLDAFLFLPYANPNLPLTMNSGVLAHEYFHYLFYRRVLTPIANKLQLPTNMTAHDLADLRAATVTNNQASAQPEEGASRTSTQMQRYYYHAYLIRAFNEGLADVWGWLYSQDVDFVSRSIPGQEARNLSVATLATYEQSDIVVKAVQTKGFDGGVYAIGTSNARFIYQLYQSGIANGDFTAADGKLKMQQLILNLLDQLREDVNALADDAYLSPNEIQNLVNAQVKKMGWKANVAKSVAQ